MVQGLVDLANAHRKFFKFLILLQSQRGHGKRMIERWTLSHWWGTNSRDENFGWMINTEGEEDKEEHHFQNFHLCCCDFWSPNLGTRRSDFGRMSRIGFPKILPTIDTDYQTEWFLFQWQVAATYSAWKKGKRKEISKSLSSKGDYNVCTKTLINKKWGAVHHWMVGILDTYCATMCIWSGAAYLTIKITSSGWTQC